MKARFAPLLIAASMLAGCDSDVVLSGNFEQWPEGPVAFSGDLPGDPAGDTVFQIPMELNPGVQWFPAIMLDDAMLFIDAACPIGQTCTGNALHRLVSFRSAQLTPAQVDNPFTWALGGDCLVQPGGDIRVSLTDGHFASVAVLRFERPTAQDPTTVTIEHGGGVTTLETLEFGESFGYGIYAEPDLGTFDVIGSANVPDLPLKSTPSSNRRGVFMWFENDEATASGLRLDGIELVAEN